MSDSEIESVPPWNFSWVVENELAAMGRPRTRGNLQFLHEQGIGHLVTLSAEAVPPMIGFPKLHFTQIPVKQLGTPSTKDILKFIDVCQRSQLKNKAVGVHCRMGKSRSGVMAACYLVRFQNLSPERAIINIRMQRPGSVETPEQERAILRYHDCLKGTKPSEIQHIRDDTQKYNSL